MRTKTRRQMLVSGAVIVPTVISAGVTAKGFSVPSIITFCTSELKCCCSGSGKGGNGNHYGNNKPDHNPKDWKNQYNGDHSSPHDGHHGKK